MSCCRRRPVGDEMYRMNRSPQDQQALRTVRRGIRSLLTLVVLTVSSIFFNRHGFYPPHGNPLVYVLAISWLVSFGIALPITAIFKTIPELLPLAPSEKTGKIYDNWSVRGFRWLLLHSPLGWINASLYLTAGRKDCERLLKEAKFGERVHWLTCLLTTMLGFVYLARGHAAYGFAMLVVRIPFDIYPIMLLRWSEGRVTRLLTRASRKPA
jgi:hypothetical protein